MYDECLVADVYDSGDAIARVKRRRGAGYVLDGSVIVTVFDFLERKHENGFNSDDAVLGSRVGVVLCRQPNE